MENTKIILDRENLLFSRKEIVAEIKSEITPKKKDVESALSEKFSSSPDTIQIDRIVPKFSSDIFTVYAKIYKSAEDKKSIEPRIKEVAVKPQ